MSQRAGVVDMDMGFQAVVAEINKMNGSYVKVGFQEGEVTKSQTKGQRSKKAGLSMPEIAAQNEFGTDRIPARPFMRSAVDMNRAKLDKAISGEYDKIVAGESTVKKSLNLIGLFMTGLIQKQIRATYYPPNAKSTIEMKKSSHPLIDFGQMIQSVRHVVVIK